MLRVLIVAAVSAVLYPVLCSAVEAVAPAPSCAALEMAFFPVLAGAAAAGFCRRSRPLASATLAAGIAFVLVSAGQIAGRALAAGPCEPGQAAMLVEGHAARAIVGMFLGLAAAAAVTLVLASLKAPSRKAQGYGLTIGAGALLAGLWACFGVAWLVQSSGEPRASERSLAYHIDKLQTGTNREMDEALEFLAAKGDDAVEPAIRCLASERGATRNYAARVLGRIGGERALGPLMALLKESLEQAPPHQKIGDLQAEQDAILAEALPETVVAAVEAITGLDFEANPAKCLEWWNSRKY